MGIISVYAKYISTTIGLKSVECQVRLSEEDIIYLNIGAIQNMVSPQLKLYMALPIIGAPVNFIITYPSHKQTTNKEHNKH